MREAECIESAFNLIFDQKYDFLAFAEQRPPPLCPARTEFPDNDSMATQSTKPWGLYLITCLTALAAAATAAFWVLGALALPQSPSSTATLVPGAAPPDPQALARALGGGIAVAAQVAPTVSTQYQLLGVVSGPVGKGYALLVVGNAPPKSYSVGATVGDGQVLQSVSTRGAKIGNSLQGETLADLSLPKTTSN